MSTKTKRKSDVTYWQYANDSSCIFVLTEKWQTPTFITNFSYLQVEYDYNCAENTYKQTHSGGVVQITEKEFMDFVKRAQAKYGVKFSIKTEWGTNASQSSDT